MTLLAPLFPVNNSNISKKEETSILINSNSNKKKTITTDASVQKKKKKENIQHEEVQLQSGGEFPFMKTKKLNAVNELFGPLWMYWTVYSHQFTSSS